MARLAPSELAEVLEFLTPRPWVRPLAGIAAPGGIVPFVRHQLDDVRVDDRGWIATAPWEDMAVTGTPRLGALAQPAVIPWGMSPASCDRTSPRRDSARVRRRTGFGAACSDHRCCAAARVHLACSQSTGETGRRVHPTG